MRVNSGGIVDVDDLVGRQRLIDRLWRQLEYQSVSLIGERRIGKTSILRNMTAAPPEGWSCVNCDLEGITSVEQFTQVICAKIIGLLESKMRIHSDNRWNRIAAFGEKSLPNNTRPHWKTVLTESIELLVQNIQVVFLFDEMTLMLMNIIREQNPLSAMELLDTLRSFRQSSIGPQGFRMVIAGSLGLHHILRELRQNSSYTNEPFNDILQLEVPPLTRNQASELAERLIIGENIGYRDLKTATDVIAKESEGFPFYIHKIVGTLSDGGSIATPETVSAVVRASLEAKSDPWNMQSYYGRLERYYGTDRNVAVLLLDVIASAEKPQSFKELYDSLKIDRKTVNEEVLQSFLNQLVAPDLVRIITRLPEGRRFVPDEGTHYERVAALLRYVSSSTGPGLQHLAHIVDQIFPRKSDWSTNSPSNGANGINIEKATGILDLLLSDYYIERDSKGDYRFRYSLICRWWVIFRHLS